MDNNSINLIGNESIQSKDTSEEAENKSLTVSNEEDHKEDLKSESNGTAKIKPMRMNRQTKKRLRFERRLENYKKKKEAKKLKKEITIEQPDELNEAQDASKSAEAVQPKHIRDGVINFTRREFRQRRRDQINSIYLDSSKSLKICIDCSFSDKMSHKEMSRLAQQIGRCHASSKSPSNPIHLTLCNLDENSKFYKELCRINYGFENFVINKSDKSIQDHYKDNMDKIAYLSPDSETHLESIDVDTTYVIGGLVDETVQKKVTIGKCKELQIKAYSLPIEKYMSRREPITDKDSMKIFNFSQVLAINHVFDIMGNFFINKSWPEALKCGVPKRKGFYIKEDRKTESSINK